ncbi:MAG: hypothetical protein KAG20_01190 [Cocleimonas sp.]|nr:hypothetical protein [Cocleimonas sp.]
MYKIQIVIIPLTLLFSALIIGCNGGSNHTKTTINTLDYFTPNKTIAKLHKEYREASDGTITLQDFTHYQYTKTGDMLQLIIDNSATNHHTTYKASGDIIEIKKYINNTLIDTSSLPAKLHLNDTFSLSENKEDNIPCLYKKHYDTYTTTYKIVSDVVYIECDSHSLGKYGLYLSKNLGLIQSKFNRQNKLYKDSYIGEPTYTINALANYTTSYAQSVTVADEGHTVFIGDANGLISLDTSDINNLTELSSINSGNFLQIMLSENENLLYAVDNKNFLVIDISNRNDLSVIASMPMKDADSFSLTNNETIAVIQDIDVTRLVDISDKNNIIPLFDLPSGKSVLSKEGATLFYISPEQPNALIVYDISNPSDPFVAQTYRNLPYHYPDLLLSHSGKELFLSDQHNFTLFDVSYPHQLSQLSSYQGGTVTNTKTKLSLSADDKILTVSSKNILQFIDLTNLNNIHIIAANSYDFIDIGGVATYGNKLFVADGETGLQILQK